MECSVVSSNSMSVVHVVTFSVVVAVAVVVDLVVNCSVVLCK